MVDVMVGWLVTVNRVARWAELHDELPCVNVPVHGVHGISACTLEHQNNKPATYFDAS
jgi:hypothetical protein